LSGLAHLVDQVVVRVESAEAGVAQLREALRPSHPSSSRQLVPRALNFDQSENDETTSPVAMLPELSSLVLEGSSAGGVPDAHENLNYARLGTRAAATGLDPLSLDEFRTEFTNFQDELRREVAAVWRGIEELTEITGISGAGCCAALGGSGGSGGVGDQVATRDVDTREPSPIQDAAMVVGDCKHAVDSIVSDILHLKSYCAGLTARMEEFEHQVKTLHETNSCRDFASKITEFESVSHATHSLSRSWQGADCNQRDREAAQQCKLSLHNDFDPNGKHDRGLVVSQTVEEVQVPKAWTTDRHGDRHWQTFSDSSALHTQNAVSVSAAYPLETAKRAMDERETLQELQLISETPILQACQQTTPKNQSGALSDPIFAATSGGMVPILAASSHGEEDSAFAADLRTSGSSASFAACGNSSWTSQQVEFFIGTPDLYKIQASHPSTSPGLVDPSLGHSCTVDVSVQRSALFSSKQTVTAEDELNAPTEDNIDAELDLWGQLAKKVADDELPDRAVLDQVSQAT